MVEDPREAALAEVGKVGEATTRVRRYLRNKERHIIEEERRGGNISTTFTLQSYK